MDYLDYLESEAIEILRETFASFKKIVLLFSGGKDSTVLVHLAKKAFYPGDITFPILHIDTGHNFPEAIRFRDELVANLGLNLIVKYVVDTIKKRNLSMPTGKFPSRNMLQAITLLDTIKEYDIGACIGGGRRDEEKARSKERIFSLRNETGSWKPHDQRAEVWNLCNARMHMGENMRVFPISNWTELDIWNYIHREKIKLPSLYFAHERDCLLFNNQLIAFSEFIDINLNDVVIKKMVRFRTVGDMTCTAAIPSTAITVENVITEISHSLISERGETRIDDRISDAAMEDRKLKGYF